MHRPSGFVGVVDRMQNIILIGFAGLVGTLGRYWLSGLIARQYGESFPWGTIIVNVIGCFLAGAVFYLTEERFLLSPMLRSAILIGLLGGFTTFSSFSLQSFTLLRDGQVGFAGLNFFISNFLGFIMVWAGYSMSKAL